MTTPWVARFADLVPAYVPIAPVHPQGLPGWGLQPRIDRFRFDGEVTESLSWVSGDLETSQSPASQHADTSENRGSSWVAREPCTTPLSSFLTLVMCLALVPSPCR